MSNAAAGNGNARIDTLIGEVLSGEIKKEKLRNSSFELCDDVQAMYFSVLRKNMQSDMAYQIINNGQETEDKIILKELIR